MTLKTSERARLFSFSLVYLGVGALFVFTDHYWPVGQALWPYTGIGLAGILIFGFRIWPLITMLNELGQDISTHKPQTFEDLDDWEGLNFDLIISLSPEAHHKALELTRTLAADVEYWPTPDPTTTEGSREQRLAAYRDVCDGLLMRIRRRFAKATAASE